MYSLPAMICEPDGSSIGHTVAIDCVDARRAGSTIDRMAAWRVQRPGMLAIVMLASACSNLLLAPPTPVPTPPADCDWALDTELAFAGEASLAELGLGAGNPFANLRGLAYVTAQPVDRGGAPQREYCLMVDGLPAPPGVEPPAGMTGSVPDGWRPPPVP